VRAALAGRGSAKARKPSRTPLETDLSQKIGLPVRVQQGNDGGGRLTIKFKQKSELDKLVRLLR
jgi:ParB family chromosome partitioning protein